jgi:hypothetical protein
VHVGDGPHCDCAARAPLRLVPPAPPPPSIATILRFRSPSARNEVDERRANLEATLAFVMMLLLFAAVARSGDIRRISDRTIGALEQSITAVDDARLRLYLVYSELQWRAGAR